MCVRKSGIHHLFPLPLIFMTAEESYSPQKRRLCAQTFEPILSTYMNIFIEKHKSHLVLRKEFSLGWGEGNFSTALDSPVPTSGSKPEIDMLLSVFSSRFGAMRAFRKSLGMEVKIRVHSGHGQTEVVLEGKPIPSASFQCLLLLKYH